MAEKTEKIRAFVAIHPPAEIIAKISELMEELQRVIGDEGMRWVRQEQLHLTLQFLGYVPVERVDAIAATVRQVVSSHEIFSLEAESLGCFPSSSRPRVLWVGLQRQVERLQILKRELDAALAPHGYQPEGRPFHPHLTLARISELSSKGRRLLQAQIEVNKTFSAGAFEVRTVELMQSVLSPKGASYRVLGGYSLGDEKAVRK